ncbi:MAG TPA: RsfA family transcriptional regulator [Pseudogracilibacillus sp.]|nr:RsfA family transcriptional regulator [Pseudogracilibacillus sp.]
MAKVRQDAWSHEDDLLLAETVLRHIREGSTQLNAFEEVGDCLNRTSAACGFRWNAEIRNQYIQAIELAKRQRKEKKRELNKYKTNKPIQTPANIAPSRMETENTLIFEEHDGNDGNTEPLSLQKVIQYLQSIQTDIYQQQQNETNTEHLKQSNQQLQNHITSVERELTLTKKKLKTMEEDYQTFMQIMDRARKMSVLEEQPNHSPSFKMDKNGNLEQLAKTDSQ